MTSLQSSLLYQSIMMLGCTARSWQTGLLQRMSLLWPNNTFTTQVFSPFFLGIPHGRLQNYYQAQSPPNRLLLSTLTLPLSSSLLSYDTADMYIYCFVRGFPRFPSNKFSHQSPFGPYPSLRPPLLLPIFYSSPSTTQLVTNTCGSFKPLPELPPIPPASHHSHDS